MTHIAVLRAGALGDVILTLPAIYALRRRYPEARITVIGYPTSWSLAEHLADEVLSVDRAMFAGLITGRWSAELQTWLASVDRLIVWTVREPDSRLASLVELTHASPYPPPGVHAAVWLLQTISPTFADTCSLAQVKASLTAWAATAIVPTVQPEPKRIYLHPGAGAAWKRWPAQRFAELAEALCRRRLRVEFVEGPADRAAVAQVQQLLPSPLPVVRETSLRQLAQRLAGAATYVGNDSGVTHLAAAAGAPVIALFGPTDPDSWAPIGDVRIVRTCTVHAHAQGQIRVCDDPHCMASISVEDSIKHIRHGQR